MFGALSWSGVKVDTDKPARKTPRERFDRDPDDKPRFKEGTLQRPPHGRETRGRPAPRTQLLEPAQIWLKLTDPD
jgi:hypothetical protein